MKQLCDCPLGFEDGYIIGYNAQKYRLKVDYIFWNDERGTFIFEGLVAIHDDGAIGVVVGSASRSVSSDLVASMIRRNFEVYPEASEYQSFHFIDLDDNSMFEVVAHSCSYLASKNPSAG